MEVLPVIPKRFKFARGVTWLFLALSILLLVYTYHRSEITFGGTLTTIYFKYYAIGIAGVIFSSIVLRLKDEIRINIIMAVISLFVGISLVEISLIFYDSQPSKNKFSTRVDFDTRSKYKVYQDLLSEGTDSTLLIGPAGLIKKGLFYKDQVDPLIVLGGISKKSTVFCNETGKMVVFLSDRYGFNNPDSEWDSKKVKWVTIGDSFTEGACVNQGKEIAGQIRSITVGRDVINLGKSSNGPLLELATLKEYAEPIKPKIVLWLYFESNDLDELSKEKSVPMLMNYMNPKFSQNLIYRQTEIDKKVSKYVIEEIEKLKLTPANQKRNEFMNLKKRTFFEFFKFSKIRLRLQIDTQDPQDEIDPLFHKILKEAKNRTMKWGGNLYFVYLPGYTRYYFGNKFKNHNSYRKRNEVIELVKNLNLPVIDIHQEVFANHPDPLSLFPLRLGGHYTAEGYSEVAKAIVLGVTGEEKSRKIIDEGD